MDYSISKWKYNSKEASLSKYLHIYHFIIIKISIRCILTVVILHQTLPYVRTQSCIQDPTVQCDTEKVINLSHVKKHLYPLVSEDQRKFLPDAPFTAPVKRIHSRHRRFIAPGASWGLKVCKNYKTSGIDNIKYIGQIQISFYIFFLFFTSAGFGYRGQIGRMSLT